MRIWVDTAVPAEIEEWDEHPWVSGFTTNPTLIKQSGERPQFLTTLTKKPISVDGPPDQVWALGRNVIVKVPINKWPQGLYKRCTYDHRVNWTAFCDIGQWPNEWFASEYDVISVFAGRIMDTGRDPQLLIDRAKATKAQVLWASVREPYNITQAEQAGCDIVTVPPAILRKYLEWNGKPLEVVAEETIAQFHRDAEGIDW